MRCLTTYIPVVFGYLAILFLPTLSFSLDVNYSNSAHGNSSPLPGYGVLRTTLNGIYSRGNCAHCHEQHTKASDGYLLLANNFSGQPNPYSSDDTACFGCHGGAVQPVINYDYSTTFGGGTSTPTIDSILEAFNQESYHNLKDIKDFLAVGSRPIEFHEYTEKSSPCSGCHNVHLARANHRAKGDPTYTAVSRPTDHDNLWGDDAGERMPSTGLEYYQPPNRTGGGLEPDGGSDREIQAAKTPDYDTSCIDCHNDINIISSSLLGTLKTFDWSLEQHGWGDADIDTNKTEMQPPYSDANLGAYVVSCMDCHEPHGSPNIYLIRSSVNAGPVSLAEVVGADRSYIPWDNLCTRCHASAGDLQGLHHTYRSEFNCLDCHYFSSNNGQAISNSDPKVQACTNCHYHGSSAGTHKTF